MSIYNKCEARVGCTQSATQVVLRTYEVIIRGERLIGTETKYYCQDHASHAQKEFELGASSYEHPERNYISQETVNLTTFLESILKYHGSVTERR